MFVLLSPEDRGDYEALVGAHKRHFGQCVEPGLLRSELCNRRRWQGETLWALAKDIEPVTLGPRACSLATWSDSTLKL